MAKLPQVADLTKIYITDMGLETVVFFEKKHPMPEFAAFTALRTEEGKQILREYNTTLIHVAKEFKAAGFIMNTPTWRASPDWAKKIGIDLAELKQLYQLSLSELKAIKTQEETPDFQIVIVGLLGPRADGYTGTRDTMSVEEAEEYHSFQIKEMLQWGVDAVAVATLFYPEEGIGIVQACQKAKIPAILSFTTETDGNLPNGTSLKEAIQCIDQATDNYVDYYMVNCTHSSHFDHKLKSAGQEPWLGRIQAIRCNPSTKSHAELDNSTELDVGDPVLFGQEVVKMKELLPNLNVFGGCCGSNEKHLREICFNLKARGMLG